MTPLVRRAYSAVLVTLVVLASMTLAPLGTATAQPISGIESKLQLDVNELTPRVVTGSEQTLAVRGTVTNTSNSTINNITARVQLGDPQSSESALRGVLGEAPPTDTARSEFETVVETLPPGQSAQLELVVPLGPEALQITQPGVYPLLVNVNGTPQDSGDARLAALNTLLPVLAPPGGQPVPPTSVPTSMLWPIMDSKPRVVSDAVDRPLVLSDDRLADSLAPGGRLYGLVAAVRAEATDTPISSALCLAIDPELLDTVSAMANGYRVNRQDGGSDAGRGSAAANQWLADLREVADGRCVIALPYADADLAALTSANPKQDGMSSLARLALAGSEIINEVLAPVQPIGGVAWPAGGTLDDHTMRELTELGINKFVVDPAKLRTVDPNRESAPMNLSGMRSPTGEGVTALPYDSLVASALLRPSAPAAGTTATASPRSVSTQNGLAALAFRGAFATEDQGSPVLVTPPRRWAATETELRTFLSTLNSFAERGMVRPVGFQEMLATPTAGTTELDYTAEDTASQVPAAAVESVFETNIRTGDLQSALRRDTVEQLQPAEVVEPVRHALLRATSSVWREHPQGADQSARTGERHLDGLTDRVTAATSGQISLASGDSPLPVSLQNELPVPIAVRVTFSEVPGLRPDPTELQRIPANSGVSRLFPAEVTRSGRFSVDVSLTTPSGGELGPAARFELASSHYGGIMLVVTGTAGAALVLLVGLRIYRRMRSDRPNDGQQERP